MRINIEYQDQFGKWNHFSSVENQASAYRIASSKASLTGKRFKLVDKEGRLMDIINP
jgi:hypothetical protein